MRDFIRDGAKEYRKDTVRGETEIFPLAVQRYWRGFRDGNPKEENSQSNWAVIREEQEDDKQTAMGIHNLIYEDGTERL